MGLVNQLFLHKTKLPLICKIDIENEREKMVKQKKRLADGMIVIVFVAASTPVL